MKYTVDPDIAGLVVFEPEVFHDVRGEYINTFNVRDYAFLDEKFVEDDFSSCNSSDNCSLYSSSVT